MFHLGRILKFSAETMGRNLWLTVITVTTITLTLLSISVVVGLQEGIAEIVHAAESRIDLSVYFFPTVSDSQVQSVAVALRNIPGVNSVTTISKEEALARYQVSAKDTPELLKPLAAIGENPFGSSLSIKADSPSNYELVIEELAKPQYQGLVEGEQKDYEANRQFINNFTSFTQKIRYGAMAVSGFFVLIACLLLFNTIRVAIYTHRHEIGIMKLVGANNRFVRTPFLVEAFFYTLLATLLATLIVFAALHVGQPYLNSYFGTDEVDLFGFFWQNGLLIFGAEFLAILFLSMVSSIVAIRKYLRV